MFNTFFLEGYITTHKRLSYRLFTVRKYTTVFLQIHNVYPQKDTCLPSRTHMSFSHLTHLYVSNSLKRIHLIQSTRDSQRVY